MKLITEWEVGQMISHKNSFILCFFNLFINSLQNILHVGKAVKGSFQFAFMAPGEVERGRKVATKKFL